MILKTIEKKTGLTATCGIGPNMLLAKLSMDLNAKKYKNGIAHWTYEDIPTKLWPISPLSRVWGIGKRMEKKLNMLGIYTIGDLAHFDPNKLRQKFGVLGTELWEHANGIDNAVIADFKHQPKEKSFSHSQVFMRDYYGDEIFLITREMLDVLTRRLRSEHLECASVSFGVSYSKTYGGGFYHSVKLANPTDLTHDLYPVCEMIFERFYEEGMPIRKISIALCKLSPKLGTQLNLFASFESQQKEDELLKAMDDVQLKYGKNSLLKASSLLSHSTIRDRNEKIGGHHE